MNERRSFKLPFTIVGSLILAATGVWLIISPYVIGYTSWTFGHYNDMVCGVVVVILGIASAMMGRPDTGFWRMVRRAAPAMAIAGVGLYLLAVDFALYYQQIGRVDTFFNHLVAFTFILGGFAVAATVLALEHRPLTPEGVEVLKHVQLQHVT